MIDRDGAVRYPGAALLAFDELGREDWILSHLCNDFEEVLFSEHPELREIKEALLVSGAAGALLSGSGSSVFGLFRSEKRMQEALAKISSEYPVDTFECRLVSQGMIIEIPVAD
jgi:4-diphosphocytidyl-2-C-methyl-D-erythritol kinase